MAATPALVARAAGVLPVFVATAFLAAGLLFSLEPLIGKLVLPLLGGSPAVWNTCLLFFQAMLLAGYAYVHYGIRLLGVRRHAILHAVLLAASLLALPPATGSPEPPVHGSPVPWLLLLLLRSIGLPFFVLSATAPLVQRWLAATPHPGGRDPYFLYAASNLGSLAGLLVYPFVLEPLTGLRAQSLGWSGVYALFVGLIVGAGVVVRRGGRALAGSPGAGAGAFSFSGAGLGGSGSSSASASSVLLPTSSATSFTDVPAARVLAGAALRWTAAAFVPSALLLAVTGYITTDLAPMPLLWLLPLSLYLATFVAAFGAGDERRDRGVRFARVRQPVVTLAVLAAVLGGETSIWLVLVHLAGLTLAAWLGHARLAAERPPPAQLTAFYLWIGVGGTLGGVFGVLLAPLLFMPDVEYAILLVAALLLPARGTEPSHVSRRFLLQALAVTIVAAAAAAIAGRHVLAAIAMVPLLVLGLRAIDGRRGMMTLGMAVALVVLVPLARSAGDDVLASERNFFGTLRVLESNGYHRLLHGRTLHGAQATDPEHALAPTTYYSREGPLGDVFAALAAHTDAAHIGIIGLGIGSATCHGRAGDTWDLYEIDPGVVAMARDPRLFSFLARCAPGAPVIVGDGRRAVELRGDARYELVILDAFSSGAIPAHMLTREAFALFANGIAPGGILAVHISNRYLDLAPVVAASARDLGLVALMRDDAGEDGLARVPSTWVALGIPGTRGAPASGRSGAEPHGGNPVLSALAHVEGWRVLRAEPGFRAWTDDYTSLLGVLRVRR
jgi:spermidine synthase